MDDTQETDESRCLAVVLMKQLMGFESVAHVLEEDALDTTITDRVRQS